MRNNSIYRISFYPPYINTSSMNRIAEHKKSLSSQGGPFYVMPEITNKNFPTLRC